MSKEKEKLIASAQKFTQKGQFDKAIKEYQESLKIDKKDVKTWTRLGDLHAKLKKNDDAIKCYAEGAKLYTRDGFYSKAIAVYKQVIALDENRDDIYLLMADLYQRLGMVGDAMSQYQRVAGNFEKDGKLKESLDIYRNMAELDPRNVLILTKLAELHYKSNNKKDGYGVFKRALAELKEANRFEEYVRLMEKLAKADPDNSENLKELLAIYLKRKVYDRSYPLLIKVCQLAPDDVQSLHNLAELCVKLDRKGEAIAKFKELAKAYQSKGLRQKAQEAMQRASAVESGKPMPSAAPEAPGEAAGEEVMELKEEVEETEVESGIEELNEAVEEEAVIAAPAESKTEELSTLTPEQIQENLTEADVYFKYGLRDKALGHVQLVLKTDPKNIEALKRLKTIMMDAKNQAAGMDALRKIALYADKAGDWKSLAESAAEILQNSPDDAPAQAWLKKADAELKKQPAAVSKPGAPARAEEPEVIEEEVVVEEEEVPAPAAAAKPRAGGAAAAAKAQVPAAKPAGKAPDFKEELEEAEFYAQQGLEDEALRVYLEILQTDPSHKQALKRVKELEGLVKSKAAKAAPAAAKPRGGGAAAEKAAPIEIEVEEPEAPAAPAAKAPAGPSEERISLEEEEIGGEVIEEEEIVIEAPAAKAKPAPEEPEEAMVGFEAPPEQPAEKEVAAAGAESREPAFGMEQETPLPEPEAAQAGASAAGVTFEVPEEPVFASTEDEPAVAAAPRPAPPVQAPGARSEDEGLFDLAAELEKEDLGPAPTAVKDMGTSEKYSFENMFKSFKEGVSKVVSETDASTHYDLGIAYKEMGLCEDAVREFRTALKAGHNPGDCHVMLGLCFTERGQFEKAIEEYEQGVAEPRIDDKQKAAMFYELGQAWHGLGDLNKSLKMFEKCRNLDASLRDVGQRVNSLKARLSGAKPERPPSPSREGVSWESAALNEPEGEKSEEEEEEAKKKRSKKITYI